MAVWRHWDTTHVVKKGDYLYCRIPSHPYATKNGYVLQHRAVMENEIKRLLLSTEVIHHKDENKKNNSLSNLEKRPILFATPGGLRLL